MWTAMIYPPLTTSFLDGFADAIEKVIANRDALLADAAANSKVA